MYWRRDRDSNPGKVSLQRFSRPPQSTTLPSLRCEFYLNQNLIANGFYMFIQKSFHRTIPLIVSLSFFMEAVDTTVINTAIPAMSSSLHVDPVDLKVALISYLLSLAIFIPISGWIADKWGLKRIFISALMIFTLSSFACGFASTLSELVIARFIQGLGGALGLPVGRLILLRTFGREHLISMMNQVVMIGAMGIMLGPVIGGVITHHFSWSWIFWVNIPIGMLAIGLAYYALPSTNPEEVPPLDKTGFILFGSGLASFMFAMSALSETKVSAHFAISIMLGSMVLLLIYAIHSRYQASPIVKTDLLRIRTFRISATGNLLSRLGFGGIPFLIPLLLQIDLHYSSQIAGLLLAPTAIGVFVSKPLGLVLLRKVGYKRFLIINTVFSGLSIWAFAIITMTTPTYLIAFLSFSYGFILSLQYSAMNSLAYADLSSGDLSAANSIMSTIQQLAQSLGVAMSALCIRYFSTQLTLSTHIFHYTFLAMGLFTLCSSFIFVKLKNEDGQQMIQ